MIKPYRPIVSFDDILAYQPEDATTHTPSPIMNAVCEVLCATTTRSVSTVARLLEVNTNQLHQAVKLETGMELKQIISQYRIIRVRQYIAEHPDLTQKQLAQACGFPSYHALWRFFQNSLGQTPLGKKSEAVDDTFTAYRKESRRRNEFL